MVYAISNLTEFVDNSNEYVFVIPKHKHCSLIKWSLRFLILIKKWKINKIGRH